MDFRYCGKFLGRSCKSIAVLAVLVVPVLAFVSAQAEENRELLWSGEEEKITASQAKQAPFFMAIPKSIWTEGDDVSKFKLARQQAGFTSQDFEIDRLTLGGSNFLPSDFAKNLGMRFFAFRRTQRGFSAEALAQAGLIQTGDIILTYRPEWRQSVAYAHLQMGISHASSVVVRTLPNGRKQAVSVEMPFDYSSPFTAPGHYSDKNALFTLHILRPKLTAQQRQNLNRWAGALSRQAQVPAFKSLVTFNADYAAPGFDATRPTLAGQFDFVSSIARMAQWNFQSRPNGDPSIRIHQYCSEFAYAFLALRDCNPDVVQEGEIANCMKPYFAPKHLVGELPEEPGLADGPNLILKAALGTQTYTAVGRNLRLQALLGLVLKNAGAVERMSEGHRKMAASTAELVQAVQTYFGAVLNPQAPPEAEYGAAPQFNARAEAGGLKRNYSPASFLVQALAEKKTEERFDYVGTILYR